jgi:lipoprotein-anchoring transpeptidase ErfK/SrfK
MKSGSFPQVILLTLSALLFNAGCAHLPGGKPQAPKPPRPPVSEVPSSARKSYWQAEGVEGAPWIVVVLGEQRAYFFKGKTIVGDTKVSSGKKKFETPPGEYKVIQKDKNHVSNLYGKILDGTGGVVKTDADMSKDKVPEGGSFSGAKMPYFLRFQGGYGMHAGNVPNYRASHGCVRLPAWIAPHFFDNAPMGTPVSVIDQIPVDESAAKKKNTAAKKGGFRKIASSAS